MDKLLWLTGAFLEGLLSFLQTWGMFVFMGVLIYLMFKASKSLPAPKMTKKYEAKKENLNIGWNDIAGANEAKKELREVVDFLKSPEKFSKLGAKVPKGVLLYGPPGTGKTLLAKAVASEADASFFATSGSGFNEMYVGVGAARVRALFKAATEESKKGKPAIIFIDEIDAAGGKRGNDNAGGEKDNTLNALLVEMDGFDSNSRVVVIAASNLLEKLDPALLRPGRFDRHIMVVAPDLQGRIDILNVHLTGKPVKKNLDLHKVAQRTSGLSGADLANLVNEAAIYAARVGKETIEQEDFDLAQERIIAGVESARVLSADDKRRVAYHEAGHALMSQLSDKINKVHKISIVPRGNALGYAINLPEEDKFLQTYDELYDWMIMLLGGRAAEVVFFGNATTGASDDLNKVSDLARAMITEYGFNSALGMSKIPVDNYALSESSRKIVDDAVRELTDKAWNDSIANIKANKQIVQSLAESLLDKEVLEREEIVELTKFASR